MPNPYSQLAANAAKLTNQEFSEKFASLSKLTGSEVEEVMQETGIKQEELAELLKAVKLATQYNSQTATDLQRINKAINAMAALLKKLI